MENISKKSKTKDWGDADIISFQPSFKANQWVHQSSSGGSEVSSALKACLHFSKAVEHGFLNKGHIDASDSKKDYSYRFTAVSIYWLILIKVLLTQ